MSTFRCEWKKVSSRARPLAAFPGTFNLPHEGGEILLRIGFIDVIELPVGISLARVEEAGVFSRDAATATTRAPPPPYDGRVPAATGSTAQPSAAEAVRQSGHCTCSTVPGGENPATPPASAVHRRREAGRDGRSAALSTACAQHAGSRLDYQLDRNRADRQDRPAPRVPSPPPPSPARPRTQTAEKSPPGVGATLPLRPGAAAQLQYALVYAIDCSGVTGKPHSRMSSVVCASETSV